MSNVPVVEICPKILDIPVGTVAVWRPTLSSYTVPEVYRRGQELAAKYREGGHEFDGIYWRWARNGNTDPWMLMEGV